tara:strand:+ start:341 stop:547 length:207 start_codon:yes stop_codon:yes gene_type:complete
MNKSTTLTTRLTVEERKTIDAAAQLLGISTSSFIRESAVNWANKISSDPEAFVLKRVRQIMRELADKE